MNITEKINSLTHDELKQHCIQQNGTALELMAEIERLKTQLLAAGKLAYACNVLLQDNVLLRQYTPLIKALNDFNYLQNKPT